MVGDESDWEAARALQAEIRLERAPGTRAGVTPPAIEHWAGEPVDAMAEVLEQQRPAREVAQTRTAFRRPSWLTIMPSARQRVS